MSIRMVRYFSGKQNQGTYVFPYMLIRSEIEE